MIVRHQGVPEKLFASHSWPKARLAHGDPKGSKNKPKAQPQSADESSAHADDSPSDGEIEHQDIDSDAADNSSHGSEEDEVELVAV